MGLDMDGRWNRCCRFAYVLPLTARNAVAAVLVLFLATLDGINITETICVVCFLSGATGPACW